MRLLLYGGTFDPPHNGHLNNLRAAAARVRPQLVVVMPAGVPPHKAASMTPAALRLVMCGCFEALAGGAEIPRLVLSYWEILLSAAGRRNYSVLTLEMLAAAYPGAELYLTVGSDMLTTFREWHRWEDILRLARLVAVSRNVGADTRLHAAARDVDPSGSRILLTQAEAVPMASSEIRSRIAAGESCAAALPDTVREIIRREGLYRK